MEKIKNGVNGYDKWAWRDLISKNVRNIYFKYLISSWPADTNLLLPSLLHLLGVFIFLPPRYIGTSSFFLCEAALLPKSVYNAFVKVL
jgi:hypothetical protein